MMECRRACQLFIVLSYILITEANTEEAPRSFATGGNHYRLSSNASDYWTAKHSCTRYKNSALALFDTNDEFFQVSQFLTGFFNSHNLSHTGVWIDVNAVDANSDGFYEHLWKRETFNQSGVWNIEDPNSSCIKNSSQCCARMTWTESEHGNLRDTSCSSHQSYLCKDVNECEEKTSNCSHICRDKLDGYVCDCNTGYQLAGDNVTCMDVDECNTNPCNQTCGNTLGSFTCGCNEGYILSSDGKTCEDRNECNMTICSHSCTNTDGSYECSCRSGFKLNEDNVTCADVDECIRNNGNCTHRCINIDGYFTCACQLGYILDTDNISCVDVNECETSNGNCTHECIDVDGAYWCTCELGYTLDTDNVSCVDVDECRLNDSICKGICRNEPGSFACYCKTGYREINGTCEDIDECQQKAVHNCSQACQNVPGTYNCICHEGYKKSKDNWTCDDIDECMDGTHKCQQQCNNTAGGFLCSCLAGFRLDPSDGTSCLDIDECTENPVICENECVNTNGSYMCLEKGPQSPNPERLSQWKKCPCSCLALTLMGNNNFQLTVERSRDLQRKLSIKMHKLAEKKKTSIVDNRTSAKTLGALGIVLVLTFLGLIVLCDVLR